MLERLLNDADQIKPGAKQHFCELLAGEKPQSIVSSIDELDDLQLARLLHIAADQLGNRKAKVS